MILVRVRSLIHKEKFELRINSFRSSRIIIIYEHLQAKNSMKFYFAIDFKLF